MFNAARAQFYPEYPYDTLMSTPGTRVTIREEVKRRQNVKTKLRQTRMPSPECAKAQADESEPCRRVNST
jgi:hypothetical protein